MRDFRSEYEEALRQCPASGRHAWLMRVANLSVFAGRTPGEAEAEIGAALTRPENPRGEVAAAVKKAFGEHPDWKLGGGETVREKHGVEATPGAAPSAKKAAQADGEAAPAAFAAMAAEGAGFDGSAVWRATSKVPLKRDGVADCREYEFLLENLYLPEEWVCGGDERATVPHRVSEVLEGLRHGKIPPTYHCANPLTGEMGLTKTGTQSMRCDATVACYRYVVAEMDDTPLEEQAQFWRGWQKRVPIPIAALIYTGGKSIHAWLRVDAADAEEWEREVRGRLFPEVLVPLGCDKTCKNASRLTRAPGKLREDKDKWQCLLFLDTWEGSKRKVALADAVSAAAAWVKEHRAAGKGAPGPGQEGGAAAAAPAKKKGRPTDKERALPLARKFLERESAGGRPKWIHHRELWNYWEESTWTDDGGEGELFARVMGWLQATLGDKATHGLARAIMNQLASDSMCHLPPSFAKPCWLPGGEDAHGWICMGEELVDIQGLARGEAPDDCRQPATPALFSKWKVPYKFDPDADCPVFKKYLSDVFPDEEDRQMALWALACAVGNLKKYEVFFFLYGDGGTGKTIFTEIAKALVGAKNASSLDLMDLDEKHAQHVLTDSMINVTSELPANINRADLGRVEATLKRAVSGEEIKVEHKGLEPYFAAATAVLFFASNSMPFWVDRTNGLRRRQRCIAFLHNQSERADVDRDLKRKLFAELSGIFNLVVEALKDLTAHHPNAFPDIGNGKRLLEEHLKECDVERAFLEETYETRPGEKTVTGGDIYQEYKNYCEANGLKAKGANLFAADIRRVFPGARKEQLQQGGVRHMYWVGLGKIMQVVADNISLY